jgi:hypothetical protein
VIRDAQFDKRRPAKTRDAFLASLRMRPQYTFFDIQQLDEDCNNATAQSIPVQEVLKSWDMYSTENSSEVPLPINMLNILDPTPGHWPAGLCKHFQFLFNAYGFSYDAVLSRLTTKSFHNRPDIGKQAGQIFSATDMSETACNFGSSLSGAQLHRGT